MGYAKLGRPSSQRRALLRGLVTALLAHEKIKTTEARAREVSSLAEKMITLGKQESLHARRQALAFITDETVVKKLFDTLAPRYAHRAGGYTRMVKLENRQGDAAPIVLIELV